MKNVIVLKFKNRGKHQFHDAMKAIEKSAEHITVEDILEIAYDNGFRQAGRFFHSELTKKLRKKLCKKEN